MLPKILMIVCVCTTLACDSSSGDVDDHPDSGALGADGGRSTTDSGAADAGQISCWTNSENELLTDADNCGVCGHSCLGKACSNGLCEATLIAEEDDPIGAFSATTLRVVYVSNGSSGWSLWSR